MTQTTRRPRPPKGLRPEEEEPFVHPTINRAENASPQGRLVLVLEHELSNASRHSLHSLLKSLMPHEDITMISGLSRVSMLQAEKLGSGLFYNRKEYLSPEQAFRMLPWREVWVISNGLVWTLHPAPTKPLWRSHFAARGLSKVLVAPDGRA